MRMLGNLMFKGEGGEKDMKEGIAMWERAAANGDAAAQANLDALSGVTLRNI